MDSADGRLRAEPKKIRVYLSDTLPLVYAMANPSTSIDQPNDADGTTTTAWKRRISELEEEIKSLQGTRQRASWVFTDLGLYT